MDTQTESERLLVAVQSSLYDMFVKVSKMILQCEYSNHDLSAMRYELCSILTVIDYYKKNKELP